MSKCTIFENIFATEPKYISIDIALERIRAGKSRSKVEEIRATLDKEKIQELKKQLPSVCFSGIFTKRLDNHISEHSGYLVLDFDHVEDIEVKMAELAGFPFVYAAWTSPGGNGIKALVKIADGKKHRQHFAALKELMPEVDASGVNESRVCYESYDPHIYTNKQATHFTKTTETYKVQEREVVDDDRKVFDKLLKWLTNKGGAFVKGERNIFIFKLASACCRFGIWQENAANMILREYSPTNEFTLKEAAATIKSAYRSNASKSGTAQFDKDVLVEKVSRKEVVITERVFNPDEPANDVIYGATVKANAMSLHQNGYQSVSGIGVQKIDYLFKMKKGEVTCLTGIGNYGKSTFYKWMVLLRVLLYGEKFASFSPEDNPPEEYYHDFVEMLLGRNCTPFNQDKTPNLDNPTDEEYSNAYDFISKYIFYLYPKDVTPTPEYTKERFLELIIKEKIDGAAIDPWNQMAHSFGGRTDEYLEATLGDFARFAQTNNIYMVIIAHPTKLNKLANGNYPCPDIYDLAGGAMWGNKMDNIIVYHRPVMQTQPSDPTCEFYSKKIRRQKTVGKKGFTSIDYSAGKRRYEVDGQDPISDILRSKDMSFNVPVENYKPPQMEVTKANNFYAGFQKPTDKLPDDFWNNK